MRAPTLIELVLLLGLTVFALVVVAFYQLYDLKTANTLTAFVVIGGTLSAIFERFKK